MEKLDILPKESSKKEFRKDFGNCKMSLLPLQSLHELQMATNWILETDIDRYCNHRKIVSPGLIPSMEQLQDQFMIKIDSQIPVAKIQIVNILEDVLSLQQPCNEQHYVIRPIFNPKLKSHQNSYSNAIRTAYFYCFTQLNAIQVWMDFPVYQSQFIQMIKELGFHQQGSFAGQAYPSQKFKMSIQDFKKMEFFFI